MVALVAAHRLRWATQLPYMSFENMASAIDVCMRTDCEKLNICAHQLSYVSGHASPGASYIAIWSPYQLWPVQVVISDARISIHLCNAVLRSW